MKLMMEKGSTDFVLETDSEVAVQHINVSHHCVHPLTALIEDCKSMLKAGKGVITHTYREGNVCADFLANEGVV